MAVAREHKRRGLPISVIVIDFFHWTVMGEWEFDSECWPDPQAMIDELDSMGIKVMVSIWPTVSEHSKYYEEMNERGLLVRNDRGIPVNMTFLDNRPQGPVHPAMRLRAEAMSSAITWFPSWVCRNRTPPGEGSPRRRWR